jgi:hypothetical protein
MTALKTSLLTLLAAAAPAFAGTVSFNRDIRPIFSDTCFQCHGPDEAKRKAGLRLDVRASAIQAAKSSAIPIVPGKPDESEVVKRLTAKDPDDLMPPSRLHKELTPAQIETVRKWIAEGAEYQGHWAFIKPERPPVPESRNPGIPESRNPIDAFIRVRLAQEGLKPSPEADRPTLIRRVSLDLTGIPPTPQEVEAFVADKSPNAFEKVVDRLLTSPRYGEKMAQQWLDFARYADSNGFQTDSSRAQWPWRDWVINAFNANMPFDEFTIEQLAGDLLPNPTRDQIVATGFNRNGRLNGEGGRIVEEWFAENVIDRVETTGMTWMALTLGCCRCHDHKFDPITQREFYSIFAFFNSVDESGVLDNFGGAGAKRTGGNSKPTILLPDPTQEKELARLGGLVKDAETKFGELRKSSPQRLAAWEKKSREQFKKDAAAWKLLEAEEVRSEGGADFTRQEDGSWLASGVNPPHDTYVIKGPVEAGTFTGLLLEALPDPSLPNKSLGRNTNGNFVLTDVDAEISAPGLAQPLIASFTRAEADYSQKGYEVGLIVGDKPKRKRGEKNRKGWAIDGPTKKDPRKALFAAAAPLTLPPNAIVTVTLRHDAITGHNIGRFRLSTTGLPSSLVTFDGAKIPPTLRAAIALDAAKRSPQQRTEVEKFFRENADAELKQAEAAVTAAKNAVASFEGALPSAMIMKEKPEPKDAFVLKRGEYDKIGEKVERVLPATLPPMPPGAPMNRLGFAKWLVSGEHPLTARVWVNRAWEKFFGTGLVKTTENLGSQAEWPSHPELLDWLATEFVGLKWDMKAMQKQMVMSATYRQSSRVLPEHLAKDPENRLLARQSRLRPPAETLRDQALAISGLLVEKIGGPSVRPYMPEGVWDETSKYGDLRGYKADAGDGLYRRTLYTIWKRTAAPPTMLMFDSPSREICTVKRSRTNTPLQALSLLNEVTYVEAARTLAQRMITEGGANPEQRIAWAFERATGRQPHNDEVKVLATGLESRLSRYNQQPDTAKQLAAVGAKKAATEVSPTELAAYTLTANVLLNLDEVVTRE